MSSLSLSRGRLNKSKTTVSPAGERQKFDDAGRKRKIQLGWMSYRQDKGKYIQVRLNQGGGARDVSVSLNATKEDIISLEKEFFLVPSSILREVRL